MIKERASARGSRSPSGDTYGSVGDLQADLYVSWIVTRVVDLAEVAGIQVLLDVPRTTVDGVVKDIEEVAAQLSMDALRAELLADAEVEVLRRSLADIALTLPLVSKGVRERLALIAAAAGDESAARAGKTLEGSLVEPVMNAAIGFGVTDHVGQSVPREAIVAKRIPAVVDRLPEGKTAGQTHSAGEVPSTEDLVGCLRQAGSELAAATVGELVEKRFGEALRNIVGADGVVELRMITVAPHVADRPTNEGFRAIVQVLGPLIAGDGAEAAAERPGVLGSEGIELRSRARQGTSGPEVVVLGEGPQQLVVGNRGVGEQVTVRARDEALERILDQFVQLRAEREVLGRHLVNVDVGVAVEQMATANACVTDLGHRVRSDLVLQVGAPLIEGTDRMRDFGPDLIGVVAQVSGGAEGIAGRLLQALRERIAHQVAGRVSAIAGGKPVGLRGVARRLTAAIEAEHRGGRTEEDAGSHASNELVGDFIGQAETRSEVCVVGHPGAAAAAVDAGVFKCAEDGRAEGGADGVDRLLVEVGDAVVALGGRALIFVAQAGGNGEPVGGPPVILEIEPEGVLAEGRVHRNVRLPTSAGSEQQAGDRVAAFLGLQRGRAGAAVSNAVGEVGIAGGQALAEIQDTGLVFAIIDHAHVVVEAKFERVHIELTADIHNTG